MIQYGQNYQTGGFTMICPKCNNDHVIKNGKQGDYQNYLCKGCKHQWQPDKPPLVYEYKKSNAARLKYNEKTYKEVYLKIRKDTFEDLVTRMEIYSEANEGKGELQKKIYEILDKHFPNINTAEER